MKQKILTLIQPLTLVASAIFLYNDMLISASLCMLGWVIIVYTRKWLYKKDKENAGE